MERNGLGGLRLVTDEITVADWIVTGGLDHSLTVGSDEWNADRRTP